MQIFYLKQNPSELSSGPGSEAKCRSLPPPRVLAIFESLPQNIQQHDKIFIDVILTKDTAQFISIKGHLRLRKQSNYLESKYLRMTTETERSFIRTVWLVNGAQPENERRLRRILTE